MVHPTTSTTSNDMHELTHDTRRLSATDPRGATPPVFVVAC